jgi:uncharacterized protein (TIGR03435 family)
MTNRRIVFANLNWPGLIALCIAFALPSLLLPKIAAQTPASTQPRPAPAFDVAVIRPMNYDDGARTHIYNSPRNSSFKAVNVNLKALLEVAYDIPDTRMFGGPDWTTTAKFDLEAKSSTKLDEQLAALSSEQGKQAKRLMLRALLSDRFKLATHPETREMPIYALVVGKGGAKLGKSSATGTTASGAGNRITVHATADDSLAVLAYELSWRLGRPVIDRTGLEGRYELTLKWADDDSASGGPDGPSLFTAIQEQLGLKLESTKGPVPVLVIDHAEKPSEN